MDVPRKYSYVIAGGGFSGLTVLYELISQGIEIEKILVIDSANPLSNGRQPDKVDSSKLKSMNKSPIAVADRERNAKGFAKSNLNLLETPGLDRPGFYWGLSCYSLHKDTLDEWDIDEKLYEDLFQDTLKLFEVQNPNSLTSNTNLTRRKTEAVQLANSNKRLKHSWLALSNSGKNTCDLTGGCFHYCGSEAPITPKRIYRKLVNTFGDINFVEASVLGIMLSQKKIQTTRGNFCYDKLIIALGTVGTYQILKQTFDRKFSLLNSPVIIMPFFKYRKSAPLDYHSHFSYTDLTFEYNLNKKDGFFGQLYLPTVEITGRILATMPRIFSYIYRFTPNCLSDFFFKRIGVIMVFLPQTQFGVQKQFIKRELRKSMVAIRKILNVSKIFPTKWFARYLLDGTSRHCGALYEDYGSGYGFKSDWWKTSASSDVFVLDTTALPSIQPGPHTLISVTLARYLVRQYKI